MVDSGLFAMQRGGGEGVDDYALRSDGMGERGGVMSGRGAVGYGVAGAGVEEHRVGGRGVALREARHGVTCQKE